MLTTRTPKPLLPSIISEHIFNFMCPTYQSETWNKINQLWKTGKYVKFHSRLVFSINSDRNIRAKFAKHLHQLIRRCSKLTANFWPVTTCHVTSNTFAFTKGFLLINPLTPNDLQRRRAVRPLKIKTPVQNLGMQHCTEGFNSGKFSGLNLNLRDVTSRRRWGWRFYWRKHDNIITDNVDINVSYDWLTKFALKLKGKSEWHISTTSSCINFVSCTPEMLWYVT
jgi:hypothetical protein